MTPSSHENHSEIQTQHLERTAFVYVRHSSPYQVQHHVESKYRQYDLVTWAQQAGWPKERIALVDDDQGVTATIAYSRGGFARVATGVGRGEAGIVIGLEVARLARNSPDWRHVMYVCRWTDTLIADENAVYDLSRAPGMAHWPTFRRRGRK